MLINRFGFIVLLAINAFYGREFLACTKWEYCVLTVLLLIGFTITYVDRKEAQ